VLPACEWCHEKPEVTISPLAGNVAITIAHERDCPTTRHRRLAKDYRAAVRRAMGALEAEAVRQKAQAWLAAAEVSKARG
jgi:hypothetical protein